MTLPKHLVIPMPHLHGVTVAVALRGGPRYEAREDGGLTHFLEHMIFRGAGARRTMSELMAAFERTGGEPEAYTTEDAFTVLLELDPQELRAGVELLTDVLLRPELRDLEAERALVLEERLERVDEEGHPSDLEDLSMALAFGGHPVGRSILGRKKQIERFTREDLERWREALVHRDNLAVALAGPLDVAEAEAALAPLREVPNGSPLRDDLPLPPAAGPRTVFHGAEGPQTELRFSFRGPGEREPGHAALRVLLDLLDGGPTGRLPQRLVDAGLAYNARAELVALPDGALVGLELAVAHAKVSDALDALRELVSGLADGIADEELERCALRRAQRARAWKDDARGVAEWAARRLLFELDPDLAAVRAAEAAVGREELTALAREVFDPRNLTVAGICPSQAQRRAVKRALVAWEEARV
ncbi:MAG: M16 family metallopeptidase [Planctomycetota bacterium]